MLSINSNQRIFLACEAVDFRKHIDGLQEICRAHLQQDPFGGGIFVFFNRSGTQVRLLSYDGQGSWLCCKRLSQGRWKWPSSHGENYRKLCAQQLQNLLWNRPWQHLTQDDFWKPLSQAA